MKSAQIVAISSPLPPDTYVYRILPYRTDLVSISSDDSLHVTDQSTLQSILNGIACTGHNGITCLEEVQDRGFVTAARDGCVRGWDLQSRTKFFELQHGR